MLCCERQPEKQFSVLIILRQVVCQKQGSRKRDYKVKQCLAVFPPTAFTPVVKKTGKHHEPRLYENSALQGVQRNEQKAQYDKNSDEHNSGAGRLAF